MQNSTQVFTHKFLEFKVCVPNNYMRITTAKIPKMSHLYLSETILVRFTSTHKHTLSRPWCSNVSRNLDPSWLDPNNVFPENPALC